MQFPEVGVRVAQGLYERHTDLANGSDDQRRQLIKMIGENICAVLGSRWGNKVRAGLGDEYRSKDGIAYREDDGTISVWDIQDGGSRKYVVPAGAEPTYPHIGPAEARFIELSPIDHLGLNKPPEPVVDQFAIDLIALYKKYRPNDPPPSPELINLHRTNTGGLAAIEEDLKRSSQPIDPNPPPVPVNATDFVAAINRLAAALENGIEIKMKLGM
jgi:hypothetical protein